MKAFRHSYILTKIFGPQQEILNDEKELGIKQFHIVNDEADSLYHAYVGACFDFKSASLADQHTIYDHFNYLIYNS